eukprot:396351-Rhodomonas_salina.6
MPTRPLSHLTHRKPAAFLSTSTLTCRTLPGARLFQRLYGRAPRESGGNGPRAPEVLRAASRVGARTRRIRARNAAPGLSILAKSDHNQTKPDLPSRNQTKPGEIRPEIPKRFPNLVQKVCAVPMRRAVLT